MELPGKEEKRKTAMGVYGYTEGGYPNTAVFHNCRDTLLNLNECDKQWI